ncbi:MAG: ribosome silencing factor [Pararhodobacter sp.]|nr:ribosome silencing factor [Pararhodobacter sp.]
MVGHVEKTLHAWLIRLFRPARNRNAQPEQGKGPVVNAANIPHVPGVSDGAPANSRRTAPQATATTLRRARFDAILSSIVTQEDSILSYIDPATPVAPAENHVAAKFTADDLLALVLQSLEDDKAEEIVQIDLRGRSAVADHMVICSGRSSRQVSAIAEKLLDRLKQSFRLVARVEGKETGDWVLIDTGDVVVHVFRPEVRAFYQLEKMWQMPAGVSPA